MVLLNTDFYMLNFDILACIEKYNLQPRRVLVVTQFYGRSAIES